jgi:hypothetical protein
MTNLFKNKCEHLNPKIKLKWESVPSRVPGILLSSFFYFSAAKSNH